ncbi:hypothetical protein BGZ80_000234 [Entomortierella chlamydospora]|uniref:Uncharacterized protein n=1 Tax=Entomortierella chlamydospora TaxID=101097 RepID=A0A9P6SYL5_9FUNG|nr:hypothetical protein BGZ80_000234 [Entomortierella chlamydospora]
MKTKIKYAKDKYIKARDMARKTIEGDTDGVMLRDRMLAECPHFDRFHAIYVGNVSVNPSPPRNSNSLSDDDAQDSSEPEEETSDIEILDNSEVVNGKARADTPQSSERPLSKRRKGNDRYAAEQESIDTSLQKIADKVQGHQPLASQHLESLLRRELALEEREREWMNRILKADEDRRQALKDERSDFKAEMEDGRARLARLRKEIDNERERLDKEIDEKRERFRKEIEAGREELMKEREELKKEKEELKKEKEEFKEKVAAFQKTRDATMFVTVRRKDVQLSLVEDDQV